MSLVRRATTEDAGEVLRLRQVMIDALPDGDGSTAWHTEALPSLRGKLAEADGDFAAFVVDHPDRPGALAALVVGTVDYRIGKAANPHGLAGYVFSVATDPDARRRGYARAAPVCLTCATAWVRTNGWTCFCPPRPTHPRRCLCSSTAATGARSARKTRP